jgi:signal peptidase I
VNNANKELAALIRETLSAGRAFRFRVRGGSMTPFIRSGDTITLHPAAADKIRAGDIVAFVSFPMMKMFVHRVVLTHHEFFLTRGDNLIDDDGWISEKDIIGKVAGVERHGVPSFFVLTWPVKKMIALLSYIGILPVLTLSIRKLYRALKVASNNVDKIDRNVR